MLRVLNIKVDGYRLLDDNFEIDFTNKTKVSEKELSKEVFKLNQSLYLFKTMAFVGSNSSGKSSILYLILNVYNFLKDGRWEYLEKDFKKEFIKLGVIFYLDEYLYSYNVNLFPNISNDNVNRIKFCTLKDERLLKAKFDKNRGKANIDAFSENANGVVDVTGDILFKSLEDTSSITLLTKNRVLVDEFSINTINTFKDSIVRNTFFDILKNYNFDISTKIFRLMDEGIEYIKSDENELIHLKRVNEDEAVFSKEQLIQLLSSGTIRGYELYVRAINALINGSVFIVDEIENCFQKNLVNNLLLLFNDSKTNKNNAQLIFSTHYVETLDVIDRRDSIIIAHKNNDVITIKNMIEYGLRPDKIKSNQFNSNVFNTSVNYEHLMDVKRILVNE